MNKENTKGQKIPSPSDFESSTSKDSAETSTSTSKDTKESSTSTSRDTSRETVSLQDEWSKKFEEYKKTSRNELISTLGIFCAIVAFLITNIKVMNNLNLNNAVLILAGEVAAIVIFVSLLAYILELKTGRNILFQFFIFMSFLVIIIVVYFGFRTVN